MNTGKMRQKTEDGYLLAKKALGMNVFPSQTNGKCAPAPTPYHLPHLKLWSFTNTQGKARQVSVEH